VGKDRLRRTRRPPLAPKPRNLSTGSPIPKGDGPPSQLGASGVAILALRPEIHPDSWAGVPDGTASLVSNNCFNSNSLGLITVGIAFEGLGGIPPEDAKLPRRVNFAPIRVCALPVLTDGEPCPLLLCRRREPYPSPLLYREKGLGMRRNTEKSWTRRRASGIAPSVLRAEIIPVMGGLWPRDAAILRTIRERR
jgi:hypothetical protein